MKNLQIALLLIMAVLPNAISVGVPTCDEVTEFEDAVRDLIDTDEAYLPAMVRLAFHDCVGGCDGCVNLDNSENAGLEDIVTALDDLMTDNGYDSIVSKADFYIYAAITAMTYGVEKSNKQRSGGPFLGPCSNPCFTELWGRTDTSDCSADFTELPSPTMDGDSMFTFFEDEFGFSRNQVVALMGAHTVGKCHATASGYRGVWTIGQQFLFDERYYQHMIESDYTWINNDVGSKSTVKYQFDGKNSSGTSIGIMLNTDFELFYNLTLDSDAKTTCTLSPTCGLDDSCSSSECAVSTTFDLAYSYSQDCDTWLTDFLDVFELMAMNGYSSDDLTTTSCCS